MFRKDRLKNIMKKSLLLLTALAVLVFSLFTVPVFADNSIYTSLGSYTAGSSVEQLLAITGSGTAQLTGGTLPEGCSLVSSARDDGIHHLLTGTPVTAGNYDFTVAVTDESGIVAMTIHCSLTVISAAPVIQSVSGDIQTALNASVTIAVRASSPNSGALSYQWYVSSENSNQNGMLLMGETSSQLTLSCNETGTRYYYCEVTNGSGGSVASTVSRAISVSVVKPVIQSIRVISSPSVTSYTVGDSLNTSGLQIAVRYENGTEETISSGFTLAPTTLSYAGDQQITVSYQGLTTAFFVEVQEDKAISGIGIMALPNKTVYKVGEAPDLTGMVLRVYTGSSSYDVNSGFTVSPQTFSSPGNTTVTVTYEGVSCTFDVAVQSTGTEGISVKVMPKLLVYTVGDTLDTNGLVITVSRDGQKKDIITGFTCSPQVLNTVGAQEITVTYEEHTCSFYINVVEKKSETGTSASATPVPVPSSEVISTVKHEEETSSKHSGIMVAVLVIAILLLALLCVCAYFAEHDKAKKYIDKILKQFRR